LLLLGAGILAAGCSVNAVKDEAERAATNAEEAAKQARADVTKNKVKITVNGVEVYVSQAEEKTRGPQGTPGPFEQGGEFRAHRSTTGDVSFPIPYAKAPEVKLKSKLGPHDVEIVALKATGFRWKNNGKREFLDEPDMLFTAKGVPVAGRDLKPFVQTAPFQAKSGASGEVRFEHAYASPPHVELAAKFGLHKVVLTETTRTGFRWTNHGRRGFVDDADMTYAARGVKAR
jgi:hypothetical protein